MWFHSLVMSFRRPTSSSGKFGWERCLKKPNRIPCFPQSIFWTLNKSWSTPPSFLSLPWRPDNQGPAQCSCVPSPFSLQSVGNTQRFAVLTFEIWGDRRVKKCSYLQKLFHSPPSRAANKKSRAGWKSCLLLPWGRYSSCCCCQPSGCSHHLELCHCISENECSSIIATVFFHKLTIHKCHHAITTTTTVTFNKPKVFTLNEESVWFTTHCWVLLKPCVITGMST